MMAKWLYRVALGGGAGLLALSAALSLSLDRSASAEHAVAPGQDSFGVAVLAIMYGPAILATAAGGILSSLLGLSILTIHRLRKPD